MEIIILVFCILSTIASLAALVICIKLNSRKKQSEKDNQLDLVKGCFDVIKDETEEIIKENFDLLSEKLQKNIRDLGLEQQKSFVELSNLTQNQLRTGLNQHSEEIDKSINKIIDLLNNKINDMLKTQEKMLETFEKRLEGISKMINESLAGIREDNTKQLDKMREVVDEKLHKSLEERLTASFAMITDKLEKVREGFIEIQNLSKGVTDLNKVLNGVKTRGTWGEISLQSLIEDVLSPEQYERNVSIRPNKVVEFCIKLPGNGKPVLLPVDSKFPLVDYQKLVEYSADGNIEGLQEAKKNLETRIKNEAKAIKEYIIPPKTTDFAIMYLPIEGLYAEISQNVEVVEFIRRKYNTIIAGPSTFAALLNSLQVGFRTFALQKNSLEIQKALASFKTEFVKFTELLEKSEKEAVKLSETLQNAIKRSDIIDRKLKVIELPEGGDTNGNGEN